MSIKYLIVGNGYLGNKYLKYFNNSIMYDQRIESIEDAYKAIEKYNPEILFNCAGATGRPNVDWCEDHKEETFNSNVVLPLNLAKACKAKNTRMVHLGSGCVYQGNNNGKGFSEEDKPNFAGSFYSLTKATSEQLLKEYEVLQLRLRMPIDSEFGPRNFVTKITNYKKVINELNSMTVVEDLLNATEVLIKNEKNGVYNITNPGPMTHKEILDLYKQIINPDFNYEIISLDELHKITKAQRSNCVLNTNKIEKEIKLPKLEKRIIEIFNNYK
jgi:dTDP-4-dehydrorhamnose reductase